MSGAGNVLTGAVVATVLGILACCGIGMKICKDYQGRLRSANLK